MNTINKKLAAIILAAVDLRESSYDKEASDAAGRQADKEREARPNSMFAGIIDYSQFYSMSLKAACTEAAKTADEPNMGDLVYALLFNAWNDAVDWAIAQEKVEAIAS